MARLLAAPISILVAMAAVVCILFKCQLELRSNGTSVPLQVLLVTAHPDDESMFFAPTLLALAHSRCCQVHILCLSNGNAEGLGPIREQELLAAVSLLHVVPQDVRVVDHPLLQDGQQVHWDGAVLRQFVRDAIQKNGIRTVLTFDAAGVSGHSNHKALHEAVQMLAEEDGGYREAVQYLELVSTGVLRKFLGPLDVLLSLPECLAWRQAGGGCCVEGAVGASLASMRMHGSQNLWYRRCFVVLSRFSYINGWRPMVTPKTGISFSQAADHGSV